MKVKEESTPATEGIQHALPTIDFTDTFSTTNHQEDLKTISKLIFATLPNWIGFLMKIRNTIVKRFGLKAEKPENYHSSFEVGGFIGFFQIFSIDQNEIMLGLDDRHLNFRVSIYNSNENQFNIKVTTLVQYNNLFGKIYMTIVKPFHTIVIKRMIKQGYK